MDFKSIYHNFPSIVYVKSRRGVYKYANKAFAKFLGKNIEEIVGKTDFDLFDHQMAHEHISHDEEVYASGESKKSPFRKYRLESGEYVWLQATKTVINLNDEEEAIFGITLDVTDQKGKLEKLEKARRFESTVHRITQGIFQQENEK
ncbi:PAS domain-containing protein, partial [bacterium]|nr:PAS domain-containing protein [bacterium]